jgi:predicted DsbA family dithiol-disulfide isomerase
VSWLRRRFGADIEWLPYDLHPEYPPEGIARADLVARYGDHFQDAVRTLANAAGLPFNPHATRVPNTRTALELAEWARTQGGDAHERLHERIMDAYWREGRDIGSPEELAECVAAAGLDPESAFGAVASGRLSGVVDHWTHWAQAQGIHAIPAFVFEGRVLVSGAQPHEVLARAVRRARESATAEEG